MIVDDTSDPDIHCITLQVTHATLSVASSFIDRHFTFQSEEQYIDARRLRQRAKIEGI